MSAADIISLLEGVPEVADFPTVDEMTAAMERRVFEIVSGKSRAQAGLDSLALDLQHILGDKVQLRYPVKTTQ